MKQFYPLISTTCIYNCIDYSKICHSFINNCNSKATNILSLSLSPHIYTYAMNFNFESFDADE